MDIDRPVRADLDVGRMGLSVGRGLGELDLVQPVQRLRHAGQELGVAGQLIEGHELGDVVGRGVGGERVGLVGARADRLQVRHRVLHAPGRLRLALLGDHEAVHRPVDRPQRPLVAQRLVDHDQELDVLPGHVVVEGNERGVVRLAVVAELALQRIALRPAADRVLRLQDEVDRLVERRLPLRIALLDIEPQQELHGLRGPRVVEGGVAPKVLEFLHPPSVGAVGGVPVLQRPLPAEVDQVVPAARGVLAPDQRLGGPLGGAVVIFIAGGVIGVEEEVAHGPGARRLHPDLRRLGFQLAPAARHVGGVGPHVAAVVGDLLDHERGGLLHGALDGGLIRRGRSRPCGRQRQRADKRRETCPDHAVPSHTFED